MAALAPLATILSLASTATSVAKSVVQLVDGDSDSDSDSELAALRQELDFDTEAATLDAESARLSQEAGESRQDARASQAAADRTRRDTLRRSVAKRRATSGSRGTGTGDGSGEAMLLGLVDSSATEAAEQAGETGRSLAAIDSNLDYRQRLNLLERSDLAARRKLAALSSTGTLV